jgi:regulator of RNase E activity RraB
MRKYIVSFFLALGFGGVNASEFPPNVEANSKVIKALVEAGSDPKKAHPLEHHFYCYTEACLDLLMEKGESQGYQIANIGTNVHEGTKYWYGDLIKATVLDLQIINRENSVMLKLASEFNADYDGWGTPVVE